MCCVIMNSMELDNHRRDAGSSFQDFTISKKGGSSVDEHIQEYTAGYPRTVGGYKSDRYARLWLYRLLTS